MKKLLLIASSLFVACFLYAPKAHASYQFAVPITVTSTTSIASGTTENGYVMEVSSTLSQWKSASHGGKVQNLTVDPVYGYAEPADLIYATSTTNCNNGNKLFFQDESYTSSTGALVSWVQIDPNQTGLTVAGDVIYACYDNSSVTTDQSNPSSTWAGYNLVWHGTDTAATTTILDSTGNKRNGTSQRNASVITTSTAQIGASALVNTSANSDYVSAATSYLPASQNFTASYWYNPAFAVGQTSWIMSVGNAPTGDGGTSLGNELSASAIYAYDSTGYNQLLFPYTANTWYYIVYSGNPIADKYYVNGVQVGGAGHVNSGTHNNVYWGSGYAGISDGVMDEFRINQSYITMTPSVALTTYNNQSAPDDSEYANGFYHVGAEVPIGGGGGSAPTPTNQCIEADIL